MVSVSTALRRSGRLMVMRLMPSSSVTSILSLAAIAIPFAVELRERERRYSLPKLRFLQRRDAPGFHSLMRYRRSVKLSGASRTDYLSQEHGQTWQQVTHSGRFAQRL